MAFSKLSLRKGFTVADPNLNTLLDEIVRAMNGMSQEQDKRLVSLEAGGGGTGGVSAHSALTDDEPLRHIDMRDDDLEGTVIDFAGPKIVRKTLSGSTVLTVANPVINHTVLCRITALSGATLTLPEGSTVIKGAFGAGADNLMFIFCEDAVTPRYLVSFTQISTGSPYSILTEDGEALITEDGELLLMEY